MKICVYAASGDKLKQVFFDEAYKMGHLLASEGHSLIFGGGNHGLMGACARGVFDVGGQLMGVAPRFFDEPGVFFDNCTEFVFTETMAQRKTFMENNADAFIVLPGGIGTFEEFFETLTLKMLGRHGKPIAMLNTDNYYKPVYELLRSCCELGFAYPDCMDAFTLCDTPQQALKVCLKGQNNALNL